MKHFALIICSCHIKETRFNCAQRQKEKKREREKKTDRRAEAESGGGDRWRRKMQGGKTNRESTQRTIIVQLSLAGCCGASQYDLLHWLNACWSMSLCPRCWNKTRHCSYICLTCSPCLCVCVCGATTYPARTETSALCQTHHVHMNKVIPLYPQLAFHGGNTLQLPETHRSAASQAKASPAGQFCLSVSTLIMPHTCAALLSARNPIANKRMKSCSPLGCLDATPRAPRDEHTDPLTDKQTERQVVS